MVMSCNCQNKFQDQTHGVGKRVHNETTNEYRCTVCGNVKSKGEVKKETK